MSVARAHFPILGPKENPEAVDYELEAALWADAGWSVWHRGHRGQLSAQAHEVARTFRRVARRKRWADELAIHRAQQQVAA